MVNYDFVKTNPDGDAYADYKHLGDIITLYLEDIHDIVKEHDWQDDDGILHETVLQLYIHEDIHAAIENSDVDSLGDAQHEVVYPIISKWMKGKEDSSLGY
jgi:hypothetical protein